MTELKPCPFCGGEAEMYSSCEMAIVECRKCHVHSKGYTSAPAAINAWNIRAERTCRCTTEDAAWCFVCSECGKSFPRNELHLAHNHGEINYCPNCGARVIGVDE